MKVKVSYSVSYISEVEVEKLSLLKDAISDIHILEGGVYNSQYIFGSFEPLKFQGSDGKWHNIEDLEFLS